MSRSSPVGRSAPDLRLVVAPVPTRAALAPRYHRVVARRDEQPRSDARLGGGAPTPEVNAQVALVLARMPERTFVSRVEDVRGRAVVVSAPTEDGRRPVLVEAGEDVELQWRSEQGHYRLRATVTATQSTPLPSWTMAPRGEPVAEQRRETFRLPLRRIARLQVAGMPVDAELLDISEEGVRCRAPKRPAVHVGQAVTLRLVLDRIDRPLEEQTEVIHVAARARDAQEIGLRFAEMSESAQTRLRAFLIAEQVRRRSITGKGT